MSSYASGPRLKSKTESLWLLPPIILDFIGCLMELGRNFSSRCCYWCQVFFPTFLQSTGCWLGILTGVPVLLLGLRPKDSWLEGAVLPFKSNKSPYLGSGRKFTHSQIGIDQGCSTSGPEGQMQPMDPLHMVCRGPHRSGSLGAEEQ